MGSRSQPSAPKTTVVEPKVYQNVTPLQSYQMAAESLKNIRKDTQSALNTRYTETGTPAQISARSLGSRVQEEANYLSSLPVADRYIKEITNTMDHYAPSREAAQSNLSEAQKAYAEALNRINEKPEDLDISREPEWAKSTIATGMPKTP